MSRGYRATDGARMSSAGIIDLALHELAAVTAAERGSTPPTAADEVGSCTLPLLFGASRDRLWGVVALRRETGAE